MGSLILLLVLLLSSLQSSCARDDCRRTVFFSPDDADFLLKEARPLVVGEVRGIIEKRKEYFSLTHFFFFPF